MRFEELSRDGDVVSFVEIGPFVALHYSYGGALVATHEDGAVDAAVLAPNSNRWVCGGREFARVVVFPWPYGEAI